MQSDIFESFEGQNSSVSAPFFKKQRGRWTRKQARIIDIMADPLNSLLTNREIAQEVGIAERYIYKLQKDSYFLAEVEKRRKSDDTIIKLRARVWKALFHQLEKSPAKIRTALEVLGDLKSMAISNVLQVYEKMDSREVDERLMSVLKDRQRANEFSGAENRREAAHTGGV